MLVVVVRGSDRSARSWASRVAIAVLALEVLIAARPMITPLKADLSPTERVSTPAQRERKGGGKRGMGWEMGRCRPESEVSSKRPLSQPQHFCSGCKDCSKTGNGILYSNCKVC